MESVDDQEPVSERQPVAVPEGSASRLKLRNAVVAVSAVGIVGGIAIGVMVNGMPGMGAGTRTGAAAGDSKTATMAAEQSNAASPSGSDLTSVPMTSFSIGSSYATVAASGSGAVIGMGLGTGSAALPGAAGFAPLVAGDYPRDQSMPSAPNLLLTVDDVQVDSAGEVKVNVTYKDTGILPIVVTCLLGAGPGDDTLIRADGTVYQASRTLCSDNPAGTTALTPGSTTQGYAIFDGVVGQGTPFTFGWQTGQAVSASFPGILF